MPTHPAFPLVGGDLSVQAISWVLDHSESTLGSRLVLIAIANHAKSDGTGAWPSVRLIAKEARLSRRDVQYCLRDLESIGELETRKGGGRGRSNLYSLPVMAQYLRSIQKERAQYPTERAQNPTQKAQPIAPEPLEPSLKATVNPRTLEIRRKRQEAERRDFLKRHGVASRA